FPLGLRARRRGFVGALALRHRTARIAAVVTATPFAAIVASRAIVASHRGTSIVARRPVVAALVSSRSIVSVRLAPEPTLSATFARRTVGAAVVVERRPAVVGGAIGRVRTIGRLRALGLHLAIARLRPIALGPVAELLATIAVVRAAAPTARPA